VPTILALAAELRRSLRRRSRLVRSTNCLETEWASFGIATDRPALSWVDDSASKLDDARQRLRKVRDAESRAVRNDHPGRYRARAQVCSLPDASSESWSPPRRQRRPSAPITPRSPFRQRPIPHSSRRRSPDTPAGTRELPHGQTRKTPLTAGIAADPRSARERQDRPVTAEVAGSSPVAPASKLSCNGNFCCRS
jgi:hypothetical protein